MENVVLTGMVIKESAVGEYDKRLVILTKERGKITAFARGARRVKSQLIAGTRLFTFGEFTVFQGKDAYTVNKVDIINPFYEISADMEATCYGCYFLELLDYYSRENIECVDMIKLIYQSLRALMNEKIPNRLVKCIYELKILTINGEYPQMFECLGCKSEKIKWFSVIKGGMFCEKCFSKHPNISDGVELDTSTLYTMQFIISSKIEKLYTFLVNEEILLELEFVMKRYLNLHIDKEFNSLKILLAVQD